MVEDEEKEKNFKVSDRRRFSAEGEARADVPSEEAAKPEPRTDQKPKEAESQSPPAQNAGAPADAASAAYAQLSGERGGDPQEITFLSFIVGLSTEGLALLGEMPHPATGEEIKDLPGAQQIIDILGVLREKTRGNLEREEQNLLDAILFDLRMKYVEKARLKTR